MNTFLFDFDGTLVDSMPDYVACMLRILDENHVAYSDDIVKIITPLGAVDTARYFIKLGLDLPMDTILRLMGQYLLDAYENRIPAKPFVVETLKTLKRQGASLNVLTASPHLTLDPCLKRLGIFDIFDNVWSCDDFSTTKTDPDIYVRAADKMGVAVDKVLFLDDNIHADKAAKAAGMVTCGVYDDSSKDCVHEMKAANDYYIYDFSQLLEISGS